MKAILLFSFCLLSFMTQAQAGKSEYEKAMEALQKRSDKKANKLMEEACNKGYDAACKELWSMRYSSYYQRNEAKRICAERGNTECMFEYGLLYFLNASDHADLQTSISYMQRASGGGYSRASLYLADYYKKPGPTQDIAKAIQYYKLEADKGNTDALFGLLLLEKKDAAGIFALARKYEKEGTHEEKLKIIDLDEAACELAHAEACYQVGMFNCYTLHDSGAEAVVYFKKAQSLGFAVPEKDIQYAEYQASPEGLDQKARINARDAKLKAKDGGYGANTRPSTTTATVTKKTCPICSGSGKIKDSYTTEKRDWDNKTITITDHNTTKACSRCNGTGYISY